MTDQRRPPPRNAPARVAGRRDETPALGTGQAPCVSGEYRAVVEGRTVLEGPRPSSTSMQAIRPAIRRTSSTSTEAVRAPPSLVPPAARQVAPRRFATLQMQAIVPLSSGRMLDDDFDFDIDADGALELDCLPSSHNRRVEQPRQPQHEPPPAPRATPLAMARISSRGLLPPAPLWPMASPGPPRSSATVAAIDPRAALVAFAGFGAPPPGVFGTPTYALRVIMRRRALNAGLARARARRSPDVGLYEASLRTADAGAVRMGIVVAMMMLTLTILLVAAVMHLARA